MLNNEKILAVRSGLLGSRSSELRSLVYYIGYIDVGLTNFNLFQKNILRFYSEDLLFGSGELLFTGILPCELAEWVKKNKNIFYFN